MSDSAARSAEPTLVSTLDLGGGPYREVVQAMAERWVSRRWLDVASGLTAEEVIALLAALQDSGHLEMRFAPSTTFDSCPEVDVDLPLDTRRPVLFSDTIPMGFGTFGAVAVEDALAAPDRASRRSRDVARLRVHGLSHQEMFFLHAVLRARDGEFAQEWRVTSLGDAHLLIVAGRLESILSTMTRLPMAIHRVVDAGPPEDEDREALVRPLSHRAIFDVVHRVDHQLASRAECTWFHLRRPQVMAHLQRFMRAPDHRR